MTPPLPERLRRRPVAHRALHNLSEGRPENSPAAIDAAIAAGHPIEVDLQLTADRRVVVFHDQRLARLTGRPGRVRDTLWSELRQLPLLGTAERTLCLSELLERVAGRVPLLLEFKPQHDPRGPLEAAAAAILRSYRGDLAVMSFDPRAVARLSRRLPDVARGLTTMAWQGQDAKGLSPAMLRRLNDIADYEAVGASFISHDHLDLHAPAVARIRELGGDILCWTIRSPAEAEAVRRLATNITFEGFTPAL